jgi:ABC-type microcin C transport system duplicated ATPase subunit YejF
VVEEGAGRQVFESPKSDYTKALLASAFDLEVKHQHAIQR